MLIDTKDYVSLSVFASKVNASLPLARYHALRGKLEAVFIDDAVLIPKKMLKKWPPKHDKMGRKPKQLTNH